MEQPRNIDRLQ